MTSKPKPNFALEVSTAFSHLVISHLPCVSDVLPATSSVSDVLPATSSVSDVLPATSSVSDVLSTTPSVIRERWAIPPSGGSTAPDVAREHRAVGPSPLSGGLTTAIFTVVIGTDSSPVSSCRSNKINSFLVIH